MNTPMHSLLKPWPILVGILFVVFTGMGCGSQSCSKDCQIPKPVNTQLEGYHVPGLPAPATPDHTLNIGFLVLDSVYNSELMAPYDIFHHVQFHTDPSMEVFTVARRADTLLTTFEGLRLMPDYDLESAPKIDVLVVPSALHNMDTDLEDERVVNWIRDRGEQADYVMSLCDGAFMLAQAGLLEGADCTTFPGDIPAFRERFPELEVKENVSYVYAGKMITSAGGALSYDPALFLVELLYGAEVRKGVAGGLVLN